MFIHHRFLIPFSLALFLLLPITTLSISPTIPYHPKDHIFINFGLPKSSPLTTAVSSNKWQSDEEFLVTPPSAPTITTTTSIGSPTPFGHARIFRTSTSYSVPLSSWGPKLIRLYLYPPLSQPTSYNGIDTTQSFLSLTINGIEILRNFSAYIYIANANAHSNTTAPVNGAGLVREVYLEVNEGAGNKALNFTFTPSSSNGSGFGFINGVEIVSLPDEIYVNHSSNNQAPYLTGNRDDYMENFYKFTSSLAMENVIRLNVGGFDVQPSNDSGIYRTWYGDQNFVIMINGTPSKTIYLPDEYSKINYTTITPEYIAPVLVYSSMRELGNYFSNLKKNLNLSFSFEVDGGFDYLVRLHFCELDQLINQTGQRVFDIYINGQIAFYQFDVFAFAGGLNIPIYRDYVTKVAGNGSRDLLWVTLVPDLIVYDDVLLNGLEIFKLSRNNGSLAAPNPPSLKNTIPIKSPNVKHQKNIFKLLIAIIGGIIGMILVSVLAFMLFMIKYRKKKTEKEFMPFMETMSKDDTSNMKWVSPWDDFRSNTSATLSSVGSSLPADLCRHFSLAQIKIATGNFDENLVIGTGGFGEVYKGSIDDGATIVAVKRLNTTSKQGAHEFQTEIKMLSRLRHINLVSLIGYCEDQGEMILVYEYMPRGTLRDHLLYKNPEKPNTTPLPWKQRLKICVGAARGLHYLHSGSKQMIIHRDVKSTNILLDDKWTPKVSDFGLSKLGAITNDGGATHVSTAVKGSFGYLDPEYYRRQQLTEKSDVYSFGVLLFEVLCARPVMNPNLPKEQVNLAVWARNHYQRGTLHLLVDSNIRDQIAPETLRKFGEIAETCVRDRGTERPSIGDVVWGLEFALQLQETAEKNISVDNQGILSNYNSFNNETTDGSFNDVTNTSRCNFSETSGVDSVDSKTTVSVSSNYIVDDPKSDSVFSEIVDPKGR